MQTKGAEEVRTVGRFRRAARLVAGRWFVFEFSEREVWIWDLKPLFLQPGHQSLQVTAQSLDALGKALLLGLEILLLLIETRPFSANISQAMFLIEMACFIRRISPEHRY